MVSIPLVNGGIFNIMKYRKAISTLVFCMICFVSHGQEKTVEKDEVNFFLTVSKNRMPRKAHYCPLLLLIDNKSRDSISIKEFNKNIYHRFDFAKNKTFYWDFLTINNQKPDDILIVLPAIKKSKNRNDEEDINIVVPPNTIFEVDINIRYSPHISYMEGYYKLCLYYKRRDKYVAEIIIKK
jgi:hypothetical protein